MATLLYVDDEALIGNAVARWFTRRGHTVHLAVSIESAQRQILALRLALDALFIDGRREQVAGPAFARGLWRIAAADVSSGNDVALLHDGPATFDAMCEAIGGARETIVVEAYIFRSDEVGYRIGDALMAAAKRG